MTQFFPLKCSLPNPKDKDISLQILKDNINFSF